MDDLSLRDRDLWRSFRRADHGILSRLAETEAKGLRQQELCDSMQWDRTRLSHHLTRMEGRG